MVETNYTDYALVVKHKVFNREYTQVALYGETGAHTHTNTYIAGVKQCDFTALCVCVCVCRTIHSRQDQCARQVSVLRLVPRLPQGLHSDPPSCRSAAELHTQEAKILTSLKSPNCCCPIFVCVCLCVFLTNRKLSTVRIWTLSKSCFY